MWDHDLERGLLLATCLMSINLVIGFAVTITTQRLQTSAIAGDGGFIEFGVLMIVGGCLMSRQPLHDSGRYTKDGEPTSAWRMARIGKQLLYAGVILFVYVAILSLSSLIIPF